MKRFSIYFKKRSWVEVCFDDYEECVEFYNYLKFNLHVSVNSLFMVDHYESFVW